eukprot:10462116-Alexandrium_andersonii.AAC.1
MALTRAWLEMEAFVHGPLAPEPSETLQDQSMASLAVSESRPEARPAGAAGAILSVGASLLWASMCVRVARAAGLGLKTSQPKFTRARLKFDSLNQQPSITGKAYNTRLAVGRLVLYSF